MPDTQRLDFTHEFPLDDAVLYLNHAAVAPWPTRTAEAIARFATENTRLGAKQYPEWLNTEHRLREQLKALINAESTDEIALVKNTSEGLSMIAYGIDWQAGDNVVISNHEFPSNRIVWESLADQGVIVKVADISCSPETAIINQIDEKTRLVSVSSVQYASGIKLDLAQIGKACQQNNSLFCVDAIQSLGALHFDVRAIHADFVVADGHKWMLGPEGLALFYCRRPLLKTLKVNEYGWHMVEDAGNYDTLTWEIATTARRFECGSPNMIGAYGLSASLSLLLEVGINEVERLINHKVSLLINLLSERADIERLSSAENSAGIVTFRLKNEDPSITYKRLMAAGVVCAARGGGVRFSPHFYTPDAVIQKAYGLI